MPFLGPALIVVRAICRHPGSPSRGDRPIDLGWAPAVRSQGPRDTLVRLDGLVWIMPLLAVPVLIHALRFFWRW